MNHLNKIGFCGDLRWVFNEEGSGAKFYKSSVYFPDDLTDPQSQSGITIDPGLDLGHAEPRIINEVLQFYFSENLINQEQLNLLLKAFGKKRYEAIAWIKEYKSFFKNKFLVPELTAVYVMDKYTAPSYWLALVAHCKELLEIENTAVKCAVHTALLSHAYNRGAIRTIKLTSVLVREKKWIELADVIQQVYSPMQSLVDRRQREGLLIKAAVKLDKSFDMQFPDLAARPVTSIESFRKELVLSQINFNESKVDATKVRINL